MDKPKFTWLDKIIYGNKVNKMYRLLKEANLLRAFMELDEIYLADIKEMELQVELEKIPEWVKTIKHIEEREERIAQYQITKA